MTLTETVEIQESVRAVIFDSFLNGWAVGRESVAQVGKRVITFAVKADYRGFSELSFACLAGMIGESRQATAKRLGVKVTKQSAQNPFNANLEFNDFYKKEKAMSHGNTIEAEILDGHHFSNEPDPAISWDSLQGQAPDEVVMAAESGGSGASDADRMEIRVETMRALLDDFLAGWMDGRHDVAQVGKRVLAMAKYCGHRAVDGMSMAEISKISGETKQMTSKRIRQMCNARVEASGGKSKAIFQQSDDERAAQAERLKGNRCFRGGKRYDAKLDRLRKIL